MDIEYVTKKYHPISESWVTVTADRMISYTDSSFKLSPTWEIKSA